MRMGKQRSEGGVKGERPRQEKDRGGRKEEGKRERRKCRGRHREGGKECEKGGKEIKRKLEGGGESGGGKDKK